MPTNASIVSRISIRDQTKSIRGFQEHLSRFIRLLENPNLQSIIPKAARESNDNEPRKASNGARHFGCGAFLVVMQAKLRPPLLCYC